MYFCVLVPYRIKKKKNKWKKKEAGRKNLDTKIYLQAIIRALLLMANYWSYA